MYIPDVTPKSQSTSSVINYSSCENQLSQLDAFLYGLPGGFILAGSLLLCFLLFGHAITGYHQRQAQPSASSLTRADQRNLLGKRHKRGPPPSRDLRPVDVHQMAMQEDAPDDIRAVALASMDAKQKTKSGSKSR